jgi:hypothetical protein
VAATFKDGKERMENTAANNFFIVLSGIHCRGNFFI